MKAFALANLALAFLLEVAALVAFAWWGFQATGNTLVNVLLGVGLPIVMAVVWGAFLAPTSKRRLSGAAYYAAQAVVFGLAAAGLWAANQPVWAVVLAVVYVLNTIAVSLTRQYADLEEFGEKRRIGG